MCEYGFNVYLECLHKIAEEIPSEVSRNSFKSILKLNSCQEMLCFMRNKIVSTIKAAIDRLWTNSHIPVKLQYLKELEENSPTGKAWRPITGNVDFKPIVAEILIKRKLQLQKHIQSTREESAQITPYLVNFHTQVENQLKEIISTEKMYEQFMMNE